MAIAADVAEMAIPRPFRVARRRRETRGVWTMQLEPEAGESLRPRPGQFTMLYAFGIGEVPISVSGAPDGPLVQTVRAVGAVTDAICAARPGAVLGVRGPFGNAWPLEEAHGADVVVVAGGIGLAPLRPALHALLRRRSKYGRVVVLYGSRSPDDLLYRPELEQLGARRDVTVDVTVDSADPTWHGKVGVVPRLIAGADFDVHAAVAFVCGPEVMMRFAAEALLDRGLRADRIVCSMERHMQCGVGHCGHCQLGPTLICRDGPVYPYDALAPLLRVREL
jgi:NAD(P)H-flavin reductase